MKLLAIFFLFFSLSANEVVLITGASRGIGKATADFLGEKSYTVYAGARNPSEGEIALDVTDADSIKKAVDQIIAKEGHIDVLINNAGYALGGPLETLTLDEIHEQMDVNFYGAIRLCQEVLPFMRERKQGRIINISSFQGVWAVPYGSLYSASKSALEALSESLRVELQPFNIFVSVVEPGMVITNFTVKFGSKEIEDYRVICEKLKESARPENVPFQTAEEIASLLHEIMTDPHPKLRYQTSEEAERQAAVKLKDLSGELYLNWMSASDQ